MRIRKPARSTELWTCPGPNLSVKSLRRSVSRSGPETRGKQRYAGEGRLQPGGGWQPNHPQDRSDVGGVVDTSGPRKSRMRGKENVFCTNHLTFDGPALSERPVRVAGRRGRHVC